MHRRPEQVLSRPEEGVHVAQGPFGGSEKQLQCTVRPERVDWVLRPAPPPPNRPTMALINVGSLQGVLQPFEELGARWLESSPVITRLAFGAILVAEASDLRDANRKLAGFLPAVRLDPDNASDFFYQINRRRTVGAPPGITVNRISKWSAIQGESVGVAVVGNTLPQVTRAATFFACRLELDVNTAGGFPDPSSGGRASALFHELVGLSKEITEKGDIP